MTKIPARLWAQFGLCLMVAGLVWVTPLALGLLTLPFVMSWYEGRSVSISPGACWGVAFCFALPVLARLLMLGEPALATLVACTVSLLLVVALIRKAQNALAMLAALGLSLALVSIWVSVSPFLGTGLAIASAVLCYIVHVADVARVAQLDLSSRLERRTHRVRYLLRERDEVTALAVHDLQSPIQAIAGMQRTLMHMLGEGLLDRDAMKFALLAAIETNEMLSQRIGSILNTSRNHLGGGSDMTDLKHMIQSMLAVHKLDFTELGVSVKVDMPPTPVLLPNDEDIQDILDVLVDNALRHVPADGAIEIQVSTTNGSEGVVTVAVHDSGPGVSSRQRANLFALNHTAQDGQQRRGMGLHLSKRRALMLGGDLVYRSSKLDGACFVATFPMAQTKQPAGQD
ncbi:sensor histidine kinase [Algirhabdus cladophorae]|uniref:sensor histidine kinase n=1 Tax=Algirhabdus cladophorae TaxID=3377108 RepID=UPI003B84941F